MKFALLLAPLALWSLTGCESRHFIESPRADFMSAGAADHRREFEARVAAGQFAEAALHLERYRLVASPEDKGAVEACEAKLKAAQAADARIRLVRVRDWAAKGDPVAAYAELRLFETASPEAGALAERLRSVIAGSDAPEIRRLEVTGDLAAARKGWQALAETVPADPAAPAGLRRVDAWMAKAQAELELARAHEAAGRANEAAAGYGASLAVWPQSPAAAEIAARREKLAEKLAVSLQGGMRAYWTERAKSDLPAARRALLGALATGTPVNEVAAQLASTYEVESRRYLAMGQPAAALFTVEFGIAEARALHAGAAAALESLHAEIKSKLNQAGHGAWRLSELEIQGMDESGRIEVLSALAVYQSRHDVLDAQRRAWNAQFRR